MNENITTAMTYYQALLAQDFEKMGSFLAENVHFIGPLAEMRGRDAVVLAAQNLRKTLEDIHFRSQCASDSQIMLAYDFIFTDAIGTLRAAVLMDFEGEHISRIELFYDARAFTEKKNEIFTHQNT